MPRCPSLPILPLVVKIRKSFSSPTPPTRGRPPQATRSKHDIKPRSPLRYPGGKAALAGVLQKIMELNNVSGGAYYEPFAGGAGAALSLLCDDVVSKIHLNDRDPRIFAFWRSVLDDTQRFEDKIRHVSLSTSEWQNQKNIYDDHDNQERFDVGFATFYLNRCNRSGIIFGSAPIGGFAQNGRWKINARFNPETLVDRVRWIGKQRDKIQISNDDALTFIKANVSDNSIAKKSFIYLDPPYVAIGNRLYFSTYQTNDHRTLAAYLKDCHLKWLLSYNDSDLIRELYGDMVITSQVLQYSLQDRRQAKELLIAPPHVKLPNERQ